MKTKNKLKSKKRKSTKSKKRKSTKSKKRKSNKNKITKKISKKEGKKINKKIKKVKPKKNKKEIKLSDILDIKKTVKPAIPWKQNPNRLYFKKIQGWFDYFDLYKQVVKEAPNGSKFLEVGVWRGKSACYMGEMIKRSEKDLHYYGVDFFEIVLKRHEAFMPKGTKFYKEALGNVTKQDVEEYVTLIKLPSLEAVKYFKDKSLYFVYLDGDHEYPGIWKDLNAWYPKVSKGGIFAGHDYNSKKLHKDVSTYVDKFVKQRKLKLQIKDNSWIIRK